MNTPVKKRSSFTEVCLRCGSPKIISKTWTDKVDTFSGSSVVEFSQLICTNEVCQAEFERTRAIEKKRQEELKLKKEENDLKRRENMLRNSQNARKK